MNLRVFTALAFCALTAACGDAPAGADRRHADDVALQGASGEVDLQGRQTGGEPTVVRFRSIEDPDYPADRSVCAAAPFQTNVYLGAALWSEAGTASSGRVVNNSVRRMGTATACVRITDPTFPPGLPQQMYARFDTPEGVITALGACTLISNNVPKPGLVLAGCHLRVTSGPAWTAGGAVTSLSVFNPARLTGFTTGSEWTIQVYPAS